MDCRIQEIGEGMEEVEFSGLDRLNEKDLLWFSEEIGTIRRCRPMTPSLPLNKVEDKVWDFTYKALMLDLNITSMWKTHGAVARVWWLLPWRG